MCLFILTQVFLILETDIYIYIKKRRTKNKERVVRAQLWWEDKR